MIIAITYTIIIFILQFLLAFGVLKRFLSQKKTIEAIVVCVIGGMGFNSVTIFILELLHIPLSNFSNILFLAILVILFNYQFHNSIVELKRMFQIRKVKFKLYNILPFLGILVLVFISVWRNNYLPITPFDTKVGIDLVAKYAVLENTIANSVFTEHLPSIWGWSNQPFYAPFTMLMQTIFRFAGLSFGKVWLSVIYIAFLIFIYQKLRETLHSLLSVFLLLFFVTNSEFFAYTFLIQTDLCNTVFFSLGIIYLKEYYFSITENRWNDLWLSAIFMAFTVWSRSEMIFFIPFVLIITVIKERNQGIKGAIKKSAIYLGMTLTPFILWNIIYLKLYLPIAPNNTEKLLLDFSNYFSSLIDIMGNMNSQVIFSDIYWNYYVVIFVIYFILNLILFRNKKGIYFIVWIAILYLMFALMLKHIQGVNITGTFRRGLFKFFPLMLMYISQSSLLLWVSKRLNRLDES